MSEAPDVRTWQEANERYLTAALAWLRLKLEAHAPTGTSSTTAPITVSGAAAPRRRRWPRRPAPEDVVDVPIALPAGTDTRLADAAAAVEEAERADPPPALSILAQCFGLSPFERSVLLLAAAVELDTRVPALCARVHGDPALAHPTFALALMLFHDSAWEALSPQGPLRYWQLVEPVQQGGRPLLTSALRADERVVGFVKGLNELDARLAPLLLPLQRDAVETPLTPSQQAAVAATSSRLAHGAGGRHGHAVVELLGTDRGTKRVVAAHLAAALDLVAYRLPAELLPGGAAELDGLAQLWLRETRLLPLALYLDAADVEPSASGEGAAAAPPVNRFLSRLEGLVLLDTRELWPGLEGDPLPLEVARPTPLEQRALWEDALREMGEAEPAEPAAALASQFDLGRPAIAAVAELARVDSGDGDEWAPAERLWDACLLFTRPRLEALAQRIETTRSWDDLVLSPAELAVLHQIADQVRQRTTVYDEWGFREQSARGLSLSVLFSGESGTGKTMAAEVIAHSLRLDLYRIDLSAVVSKYIGETEKNLRRLFDAAEDGGCILFFDEADALFGKRSEVKDAHDRYANIEVNYLLQRLEAYQGLAVLATNMQSALDPAFARRLRFKVVFPFPGAVERRGLWERAFPPSTPVAGLALDRLARLNLTGGDIRSVAMNAAFLAAQRGTPVTMPLVLDAARTELRKLGRPVTEADFRWDEPGSGEAVA